MSNLPRSLRARPNGRALQIVALLGVLTPIQPSAAAPSLTVLTNAKPLLNQSGQGVDANYRIDVPAGRTKLIVRVTGGTGSCSLLVRHGQPATLTQHDDSSAWNGTNQVIVVNHPKPGPHYALVQGRPKFQGLTVSAEYIPHGGGKPGPPNPPTPPNPSPATMANLGPGHWVHHQNGAAANRHYRIYVPTHTKLVLFTSHGGKGSCALHVRRGQPASVSQKDRVAAAPGTNQKLVWHNPPAGWYYLMLHGRPTFQGVSVMANYVRHNWVPPGKPGGKPGGGKPGTPPPPPGAGPGSPPSLAPMGPGHAIHNQNGKATNRHYRLHVPHGTKRLVFRCNGGAGSCALLVRRGGLASPQQHQWAGHKPGTWQRVEIHNPAPGEYFALLHGRPEFKGVSIVAWFVH